MWLVKVLKMSDVPSFFFSFFFKTSALVNLSGVSLAKWIIWGSPGRSLPEKQCGTCISSTFLFFFLLLLLLLIIIIIFSRSFNLDNFIMCLLKYSHSFYSDSPPAYYILAFLSHTPTIPNFPFI